MIKVDFHNHSTCSDGILTPSEMVERAYNNKVKYFALTDHDTVEGLNEAYNKAKELGIYFIPGIELSTSYNNESIHILGYFKDDSYNNKDLIYFLKDLKNKRIERAKKIIKKLKTEFNIEINYEDVKAKSNGVVARPHIARAIIDAGYNYTFDYIFNNFIGKNSPAYVSTEKVPTAFGINLLKKYNALVFLAHPVLIKKSKIDDFLNMGFDGIEAIYIQNTKEDTENFINLALKNNLLISAGSDCHGNSKDDTKHGDIGNIVYNNNYLDSFISAYERK